ncbi:hypothetical protein N7536_005042 [Penicillium majusculum]|nr:hypothetical protein N7536_005042 [Penicillium majusculum]
MKFQPESIVKDRGKPLAAPALALKSLNPDLVESYVTRHVDETSFIQTNSTLTAPSQSRVPRVDFVVRPPAEEVTAEKKTGRSNKAAERLRRKTQQYEEQLSILRKLRENHELLIRSLWNESKALRHWLNQAEDLLKKNQATADIMKMWSPLPSPPGTRIPNYIHTGEESEASSGKE